MIIYEKKKNDSFQSRTFDVTPELNGKTVFVLLKHFGTSLSLIRSLKHYENGILLDKKEVKTTDTVKTGQTVEIRIPCDKKTAVVSDMICDVSYEDDCVIVFDKPAGMTVHPVKDYRTNTLANAFANHMSKQGKSLAFRPINRLDKDTSGLAVAALDRFCAAKLSGKIDKEYIAVCSGVTEEFGTIDLPIGRMDGFGIRQQVRTNGAKAVTHYRTLMSNKKYSVVSVKIDTGRLHQIRVHFSHIGHPLLGDDMYEGDTSLISRQALHCQKVSFVHPVSGRQISVETQLPEDIRQLLRLIFETDQIKT